ncbi:hypothetical protein [Aestuariivirga sp.]|uniref:hypothetical protein n=1 Tax=Aestuariivirga sp. TaxID=2650926 RepID=UPI0035B1F7BC
MQQMLDTREKHQIPEDLIKAGKVADWCVPWVLENARAFARPVPYEHPSGAVVWVRFEETVSDAIAVMLSGSDSAPSDEGIRQRPVQRAEHSAVRPLSQILAPITSVEVPTVPRTSTASNEEMIGRTQVTEGNLKNNHLYLRGFFDRFPQDVVGGSNRQSSARRTLRVRWHGSEWHETDLDGKKQFFRSRSLVREFFEVSDVMPGDWVEVERVDPYHYVLHHKRA